MKIADQVQAIVLREKQKREFFGFTYRHPDMETVDAILAAQINMAKMLDHLMSDKSDDV